MALRSVSYRMSVASVMLAVPAMASAASLLSDPSINVQGNGFGNVQNILTLQNTPTESGSVSWNGSANVYTGDADTNSGKSSTFLISAITSDPNRLGIIFNLNDSGNSATQTAIMTSLTATFYDSGGTLILSAPFNNPGQVFPQSGGGVGGSGNPFKFSFTPAEVTLLSAAGVRIGLSATVGDVDNGPDTFEVAQLPSLDQQSVVPLPGSALAGSSILGGLICLRRYRRREMLA